MLGRHRSYHALQQRHGDRTLLGDQRDDSASGLRRRLAAPAGRATRAAETHGHPAGGEHWCRSARWPALRVGCSRSSRQVRALFGKRQTLSRQRPVRAVVPDDPDRPAARLPLLNGARKASRGRRAASSGSRPSSSSMRSGRCLRQVPRRQETHQPGRPRHRVAPRAGDREFRQRPGREAAAQPPAPPRWRRCGGQQHGQFVHAGIVADQHHAAHGLVHVAQDVEQLRRRSPGRAPPSVPRAACRPTAPARPASPACGGTARPAPGPASAQGPASPCAWCRRRGAPLVQRSIAVRQFRVVPGRLGVAQEQELVHVAEGPALASGNPATVRAALANGGWYWPERCGSEAGRPPPPSAAAAACWRRSPEDPIPLRGTTPR